MSEDTPIRIDYFTDILCVWAYVGHRRVEELARHFGDRIDIRTRFCSVFSDAHGKLEAGWAGRGGFAGYAAHVADVTAGFGHAVLSPQTWTETRPASSAPAHQFLKAVELAAGAGEAGPYLDRPSTRAGWALRRAFFAEAHDISDWTVQAGIAEAIGIAADAVFEPALQAQAAAALAQDFDMTRRQNIEGSPTYVLNAGRQKLFGNVGYRLLEANVEELLHRPGPEEMSWC